MPRIIISILLIVLGITINAQNYSNDVTLVSDEGTYIIVTATATADKKKDAEALATKSAFNAIFHEGLEGLKNGTPAVGVKKPDYDYRFFTERRYLDFLEDNISTVNTTKVNNRQKVTVQLSIALPLLVNDLKRNNVTLSPNWQDKEEVAATVALNPTIVIVPYAKAGNDDFAGMRELVDSSAFQRHIVSAVSAEFNKRGYKTKDFVTVLQNSMTSSLLQDDTQSDLATAIARQMPGDIIVTVNGSVNTTGNRRGSCSLSIRAVELQTATTLAETSLNSGEFQVSDSIALANYALKKMKKDFFTSLSKSFEQMVNDGRSVVLEFNLSTSVDDWDFDQNSPETDNVFKTALKEWLRDSSQHGVHDMSTHTNKYILATLNIPLWDGEQERSYTLYDFDTSLRDFLRTQLGDAYQATVTATGQKLTIIIE